MTDRYRGLRHWCKRWGPPPGQPSAGAGIIAAEVVRVSSENTAWRIAAILAVIAAGAALGDEGAHVYPGALYFWDTASYVTALDAVNPYRSDAVFPFLYPPSAADIFKLGRSHLFELMAVAYAGAIALFAATYSRLEIPRKLDWLFAITAMGGMGVVSLKSGNVAITMNFTLLALALGAATGQARSRVLLPGAIGAGALIKPQFALYLGLLFVLERSKKLALIKAVITGIAVAAVYAGYMLLQPAAWNDYVAAVANRTMTEKDFGWGATQLFMHLTGSTTAALTGFAVSFSVVAALCWTAARRSPQAGALPLTCLALVALTFANPRVPLYDLYAAGIALVVCCALSSSQHVWVLVAALAINLVPWLISEFARTPAAWPWWAQDYLLSHMTGFMLLLLSLARSGLGRPDDAGRVEAL